MSPLILASTSPYRKELLERLMIPFQTHDSQVDEDQFKNDISDPLVLTKTLAFEKAKSVFNHKDDSYIIGGDQIGLFENQILGKPKTKENAVVQLRKLAGKTHELITSTCILGPNGFVYEWTNHTTLRMRSLTLEEIKRYIDKDDPLNCAGSYKIESVGISLFESIQTEDSTAIVGLPLIELSKVLRTLGFELP
ncbi:MAG: septum formation protein Maf [Halobacteriovoraceae bacterium]|nr:septum formation protein Maf [Halobacteriovoraceae bacterium]MBC97248.1 septum formation protein Maf [Halobacteriovoraceae bacterium]|tara:strand:- start:29411 stop:29992 length:582 start_codon:yes stop_codon:yes gene_type:complete